MFKFFKKKSFTPRLPEAAKGHGVSGSIAFSNSERTWEEEYNLLTLLAGVLRQSDIECEIENEWVKLLDAIYLKPEMISLNPMEPDGVRTCTTISVCHEQYAPEGFFEYQHASGDNTQASFIEGFSGWLETDFPALQDAFNQSIDECTRMEMSAEEGKNPRVAVLGHPTHMVSKDLSTDEEHPFCPCCLLTNSFDTFKPYFEQDNMFAIRLLALRDHEGNVSADCRINGDEFSDGKLALANYARTWPDRGYEMRKQYVIIHSLSEHS